MFRKIAQMISAICQPQRLALLIVLVCMPTQAERIKDISVIEGVRHNQLVGYGLVVGLDGTGDQTSQTPFTIQTFKNMLSQFGIVIPDGVTPQLKNVAAVTIHSDLPPFSKPGQTIDITVSSIGNAKSLRGGSLLMTPLKGIDGRIYAIAQGNLVVGGFGAAGSDGSKITVNIPSVGRIPGGATVERSIQSPFTHSDHITFQLLSPDYTTAMRVSDVINELLGPNMASALDASAVRVTAPISPVEKVEFLSVIENLEVEPAESPARIIVNSRTGTIVIGKNVEVKPVAVSHGNLIVTIKESKDVVQPEALAEGETAVVEESDIAIVQEDSRMFLFDPGVTLDEIVRSVNQVGAAPGDLIAILEALKQAGALQASLIVI